MAMAHRSYRIDLKAVWTEDGKVVETRKLDPDKEVGGLSRIFEVLGTYIAEAMEHEDSPSNCSPEDRLEDFITYLHNKD